MVRAMEELQKERAGDRELVSGVQKAMTLIREAHSQDQMCVCVCEVHRPSPQSKTNTVTGYEVDCFKLLWRLGVGGGGGIFTHLADSQLALQSRTGQVCGRGWRGGGVSSLTWHRGTFTGHHCRAPLIGYVGGWGRESGGREVTFTHLAA